MRRTLTAISCIAWLLLTQPIFADERPNRKELLDELFLPAHFGSPINIYTVLPAAAVILDATCEFPPGDELGPNERCIVLDTGPGVQSFNERELSSVNLPKNTFHNFICPVFLNVFDYRLENAGTTANIDGRILAGSYITIESNVLRDPRAVDPDTLEPYNGKLDIFFSTHLKVRNLRPGDYERERESYTRVCNAGVSKELVMQTYGLPAALANELFRAPMTIHAGIWGNVRAASSALLITSVKIEGN